MSGIGIVVDSRERDLIQAFSQNIVIKDLQTCGDLLFYNIDQSTIVENTKSIKFDNILVTHAFERKTATDLANSIVDKRYYKQIQRMSQLFGIDRMWFIIEGLSSAGKLSVGQNVIHGFMTMLYSKGVRVIQTQSVDETIMIITNMKRKIEKFSEDQLYDTKTVNMSITKELKPEKIYNSYDYAIAFLTLIPGIGPKRAVALLQHYRSLYKLIEACNSHPKKTRRVLNRVLYGMGEKQIVFMTNILSQDLSYYIEDPTIEKKIRDEVERVGKEFEEMTISTSQ
jgi:ERCC4-type nuclease